MSYDRVAPTKRPTCVEAGECRPPHRSTKDTRAWCKGRVGIPHTWEWRVARNWREARLRFGNWCNRVTEERVCFGCEKVDVGPRRYYCAQCGEPWAKLLHASVWPHPMRPCARCGAPFDTRRHS